MSASDGDRTTNDQLAAHLSRQDTRLDELFGMLAVSIADRAELHRLSAGHEQRLAGLEARMTVREQQDARIERAIAMQLRLSDWWAASRVRVTLGAVAIPLLVAVFAVLLQVLARAIGWL